MGGLVSGRGMCPPFVPSQNDAPCLGSERPGRPISQSLAGSASPSRRLVRLLGSERWELTASLLGSQLLPLDAASEYPSAAAEEQARGQRLLLQGACCLREAASCRRWT